MALALKMQNNTLNTRTCLQNSASETNETGKLSRRGEINTQKTKCLSYVERKQDNSQDEKKHVKRYRYQTALAVWPTELH